jgi:hypothetical protein
MKERGPQSTMLVLSTGFLIINLVFNYKWSIYLALSFGLIGIISEPISLLIEKWWLKLSNILGSIMPKLILSLIFYFLLTPIAFLYKIFNKNKLGLTNKCQTNFINYSSAFSKQNLEKTW